MAVKITINFSDPVDADAFVQHYVNVHVPLVQGAARTAGVRVRPALTNFDGSEPDVFWSISMTFDDEAAMHAAFESPEGKATMADMPNYQAGSISRWSARSSNARGHSSHVRLTHSGLPSSGPFGRWGATVADET